MKYPTLERKLAQAEGHLITFAEAYLANPCEESFGHLAQAAENRDKLRTMLRAVEAADPRLYENDRWTGSYKPKSYLAPGSLPGAAAELDAKDPPRLLSRRQKEV
jgi:hypothetical protein